MTNDEDRGPVTCPMQQHDCADGWICEKHPERELFVHKREGQPVRCTLWSHPLGYELRLFLGGSFIQTRVVRDPGAIDGIAQDWEAGLVEGAGRAMAEKSKPDNDLPKPYTQEDIAGMAVKVAANLVGFGGLARGRAGRGNFGRLRK
jgi:hypothetical protein